jgi:hypothetical protein
MTHTPDDPNDPGDGGAGKPESGAGREIDEDAAWREIVANYGAEPDIDTSEESAATAETPEQPEDRDERLRGLFQPRWDDPLESGATWEDEGHFVPPTPPPVVVQDPRRRLAWAGLFGSPLLMLVSVVLGWRLPDWMMFGLAVGFTGGFVYLVATMPKRGGGDGYGDDGAVV